MKIFVTKKDIENGLPMDYHSCPVALALRRKLKIEEGDFGVREENFEVFQDGFDKVHKPPKKVREFIKQFDEDGNVKPFSFNLKKI